jgi:hypothetical protein
MVEVIETIGTIASAINLDMFLFLGFVAVVCIGAVLEERGKF